jgi:hypothetical protein
MKIDTASQRSRIPCPGWIGVLLAAAIGLAAADDPAELAKARDAFRAKLEDARTAYLNAVREAEKAEQAKKAADTRRQSAKRLGAPAELVKLRNEYRAKLEGAGKEYLGALREAAKAAESMPPPEAAKPR